MLRLALPPKRKTLVWPVCDRDGRLVCVPFSIENLHRVARRLRIKKKWFNRCRKHPHYNVPLSLMVDVRPRCEVVSRRKIVEIIRSTHPRPPAPPLGARELKSKLGAMSIVRQMLDYGFRLRER